MKSRIAAIWISAVALLLASLLALSLLTEQAGYADLLMVTPSSFGVSGLSPEKLEEFSEDEFLLTYEIRQPAAAQATGTEHSATLVGTNHSYAGIMGYRSLDGSFFTKSAMDSKNKHVALNEAAAFQLFGSLRVSGNTLRLNGGEWIVTGVIQDNDDENSNLYVPALITGGQADSLMVLTDRNFTAAYVKNALKSIGVHDSRYNFINLSESARAFGERFSVAWKAALLAAALLFIFAAAGALKEKLRFYRYRMREMYFKELLDQYREDFLKTAVTLLLFAAGAGAALSLSLQILGTCLTWRELAPITGELAAGDFGCKLSWLRDYQAFGSFLFGASVCLVILGLLFAPRVWEQKTHKGARKGAPEFYGGSEPA